jgi:hypothetical protein
VCEHHRTRFRSAASSTSLASLGGSTGILIVISLTLLVAMGWIGWRVLTEPHTASVAPESAGA